MAKYYIVNELNSVCSLGNKKCRAWMMDCKHPKVKAWEPVGTLYKTLGAARGFVTQKTNFGTDQCYRKSQRTERQICELDSDDFMPISLSDHEKYEKLENVMTKVAERAQEAKIKAES